MRKNHGWAAFWQKKQYIIAGTLVILAAVGMTVLYSRGQEQRTRMWQWRKRQRQIRLLLF